VAQVMHLHYLRELRDRFEVRALCDISPGTLEFAGTFHPEARRLADWRDLVAEDLDAVLVLTPGSHAPVAVTAAEAGRHVFVEKPMCLGVDEGRPMLAAAEKSGVVLMVGYMKRYDPAYEALADWLPALREEIRLARITTLESPLEPYVAHYPLHKGDDADPALLAELAADDERRITAAIGTDDPVLRQAYRSLLLDSAVHELNGVRGLLGNPDELLFADVWGEPHGFTATFSFGPTESVFVWVDLPGIAAYEQDWSFYAPSERASLVFPSPFLRNAPTKLVLASGEAPVGSFEEAFKRELVEFHTCIVEGREPKTDGADGLADVALCQAIVEHVRERHEARALH
jgi:predicted dehydrogenase